MIEIAALDMARKTIADELENVDHRILNKGGITDHATYCEAIGWHRALLFADQAITDALAKVREA